MSEMRKFALMVYILLLALHFGRPTPTRLLEVAAVFDNTYSTEINPFFPQQLASTLATSEPDIRTALLVEQHRPSDVLMAALVSKHTSRPLSEILGKTNDFNGVDVLKRTGVPIESALKAFREVAASLDPMPLPRSSDSRPHATIAVFGN